MCLLLACCAAGGPQRSYADAVAIKPGASYVRARKDSRILHSYHSGVARLAFAEWVRVLCSMAYEYVLLISLPCCALEHQPLPDSGV